MGKEGRIWKFALDNTNDPLMLLDISEKVMTFSEAGVTGIAFHPGFNDASSPGYRSLFLYYNYKFDDSYPIYARLSRFEFSSDLTYIRPESEQVLIQQADRDANHNAGDMFFGVDGFLYLSIGDEGKFNNWYNNAQRIDHRLYSGILRIDVDQDETRSHPIRRFPTPPEALPEGYPNQINEHYYIPDDNPWVDEEGRYLEEFFVIGLRNPYVMHYDEENEEIWVTDVGDDIREEVNVLKGGNNAQWAFMEGTVRKTTQEIPNMIYGRQIGPIYEYGRDKGNAIIGGILYKGNLYPELTDKYLFGDWEAGTIWQLDREKENPVSVLVRGRNKVTGFFTDSEGQIYIFDFLGNIYELQKEQVSDNIPTTLAQLGAFENLKSLQVTSGLLPYQINAPLWSDGAAKKRWVALPERETISYNKHGQWSFPKGTVLVKHFEKEISPDSVKNLETRFFVIDRETRGYGITYRWNEDDTDAVLVGDVEEISDTLSVALHGNFDQVWNYPTRDQCLRCHNEGAGYVLGLKTAQLNKRIDVDGQSINQLDYWNSLGIVAIDEPVESLPKMYPLAEESASLEIRIRSYLDANCGHCHGASVASADFDARFSTELRDQGLINANAVSFNSDPTNQIVSPGNLETSELWIRDASLGEDKMPPIAKNQLDSAYLNLLRAWIEEMELLVADNELTLFPNPVTSDFFRVESTYSLDEIRLYTMFGAEVPVSVTKVYDGAYDIEVPSSALAGVYFLRCISRETTQVQKIKIQR